MFGLTEGHPGMTQEEATEAHKRAEKLAGLISLGDFLTTHPNYPISAISFGSFLDTKEELFALIRGGAWEKRPSGPFFYFTRKFRGDVQIWLALYREQVCERVVTGTRWVEPVPAAEAVEGYEEETVEWICPDSIMKAI